MKFSQTKRTHISTCNQTKKTIKECLCVDNGESLLNDIINKIDEYIKSNPNSQLISNLLNVSSVIKSSLTTIETDDENIAQCGDCQSPSTIVITNSDEEIDDLMNLVNNFDMSNAYGNIRMESISPESVATQIQNTPPGIVDKELSVQYNSYDDTDVNDLFSFVNNVEQK